MDPEQTFMRVHARLSGVLARLLTPRFRTLLEYLFLMNALLLLGLLVNMHVNFVGQPGCASAFWKEEGLQDAQIIQIKITDSWMRTTEETLRSRILPRLQHMEHRAAAGSSDPDEKYDEVPDEGWNVLAAKFWLNLIGTRKSQALKRHAKAGKSDGCVVEAPTSVGIPPANGDPHQTETEHSAPEVPGKGPVKSALRHYISSWSSYSSSLLKRSEQNLKTFWQLWGGRKKLGRFAGSGDTERKRERIAGWESTDGSIESDSGPVAWSKPDAVTDGRSRMIEPTYLYSTEKGYLMLSETAKHRSNVKKLNISISAQDLCFGNRWQQFVIDNFVGYDTILMNSLLNVTGNGYLYNFQTKELYNLNYLQDFSGVPHGLDDFIVFKCGVLITSLFVFFTTTMSVSFTLRETQSRMLKFTVQLQHHARHRLPTYRLIFVHVVESLVFVPIMIGILFFLFEFFDDQLLAFMVLTLVWLCELFTMISARTVLSMQYFPRFFFLYFMVFHIYFFSYTYGFSYLAFSTAGAFMQHLVLYFWNRFEVPALQAYLRRRTILHHQGVHIHSTLFATTVQVARASPNSGANQQGDAHHQTSAAHGSSLQNPYQGDSSSNVGRSGNSNDILSGSQDGVGLTGSGTERSSDVRASRESLGGAETGVRLSHGSDNALAPPTAYTAFGSVLPWIFGGPTGGIVSLLPIFRETRDQGFDSAAVPQQDDLTQRSWQRASSSEEGLRHRQAQQPEGNAS